MVHYTYIDLIIMIVVGVIILVPATYALIWGAPFVPNSRKVVRKMFEYAGLKEGKDNSKVKLYDLGCGDGRVVHMANKLYGVQSIGYEFAPHVFAWAKFWQIFQVIFWKSKAKIKYRDFYSAKIDDADIMILYLMPETLARLAHRFKSELKPGTIIVSYAFEIKGMTPKKLVPKDKSKKLSKFMIYEI